jgi:hypothetical protein
MEEAHAAGLSADQAADLHRASAAPEPRLCQLETAQPLAAALRQVPTWLSRRLTPSSAGNGANALESVHAQLRKIIKTPW